MHTHTDTHTHCCVERVTHKGSGEGRWSGVVLTITERNSVMICVVIYTEQQPWHLKKKKKKKETVTQPRYSIMKSQSFFKTHTNLQTLCHIETFHRHSGKRVWRPDAYPAHAVSSKQQSSIADSESEVFNEIFKYFQWIKFSSFFFVFFFSWSRWMHLPEPGEPQEHYRSANAGR